MLPCDQTRRRYHSQRLAKNMRVIQSSQASGVKVNARGLLWIPFAKAIRLCSKMGWSGFPCLRKQIKKSTDWGTPFEPPTCDTFTLFRGCLFLADSDTRRMDIYGALSKRRFQVSLDGTGVSSCPSTGWEQTAFPGSLRRGRSNRRLQVPFDAG